MKKILMGLFGLAAMIAPASAADLAARPYAKAPAAMIPAVYDWSGFYIGANGGWGTSRKCWDNYILGQFFASEGCHDATGGTAGAQIGYRWQTASWVFGLEAQGNWADFKGRNVNQFANAFTNESKIGAFGLFTGQIGYAWNNVLLYVRGGAAVTDDRFRIYSTIPGTLAATTGDDTRWGGTVGAGVEFGFTPNWSAGVAYDHMFMDSRSYTFTAVPGGGLFETTRIKQDVDVVTVRVNYRWGGPVIAKY